MMRRVTSFLDAILRDRRPPRFEASDEEACLLQTAAALHAARPGAGTPRPAFVNDLRDRLRREVEGTAEADPGRRRFLRAAGVAAAAAAGGVAGGHLLDQLVRSHPGSTGRDLVPDQGSWADAGVGNINDLADGAIVRFSAGGVEGVVRRVAGGVEAMSAVCTHMGCILRVDTTSQRLRCPCHEASFDLEGLPSASPEYHLTALPRLHSRVVDGRVEVLVPHPA